MKTVNDKRQIRERRVEDKNNNRLLSETVKVVDHVTISVKNKRRKNNWILSICIIYSKYKNNKDIFRQTSLAYELNYKKYNGKFFRLSERENWTYKRVRIG